MMKELSWIFRITEMTDKLCCIVPSSHTFKTLLETINFSLLETKPTLSTTSRGNPPSLRTVGPLCQHGELADQPPVHRVRSLCPSDVTQQPPITGAVRSGEKLQPHVRRSRTL